MGKSKAKNVMEKVSDDVEKCEWFEWIAHSCTADGLVAVCICLYILWYMRVIGMECGEEVMTGKWRMWRETNDCCETRADANQYQASRYQPLNAEHTPTYHISSEKTR